MNVERPFEYEARVGVFKVMRVFRQRGVDPIIGRPRRIGALPRLIEHMQAREGLWFASREWISRYWRERFPAPDVKT